MSTHKISPRLLPIEGSIVVPGSKSIANRALLCAALAQGVSNLQNVPDGDDTEAMVHGLSQLGAQIERSGKHSLKISGGLPCLLADYGNPSDTIQIDAQLAGTTSRFLLALGAISHTPITITGEEALRKRPIGPLVNALRTLGARVLPSDAYTLPLTVCRPEDGQDTQHIEIRGDVSSQYISALMMVAPLLKGGLEIVIQGELVSRSYVEMTVDVMRQFGVVVTWNEQVISIPASQYVGANIYIEPDFSSAAFPIAAVAVSGGTLRLRHLGLAKGQGDSEIVKIAQAMGLDVEAIDDDLVVHRDRDVPLRAYTGDLSHCSDLVPAVAVMCAVADGVSHLDKIGFIRGKESDRLSDLAAEMSKLGCVVKVLEDGLRITGTDVVSGAVIDTHHDHRLAMALALLGMRAPGVFVTNSNVVTKSWPSFWSDMSGVLPQHEVADCQADSIAVFDFDNTLTIRDCVWPFMVRVHGRGNMYKFVLRNAWSIGKAWRRGDRNFVKELLVNESFSGKKVNEVRANGAEFAAFVVEHWMRSDIAKVLRWHQMNGHMVLVVSASLDAYMLPVAQLLELDGIECTQLESVDGLFTGSLVGVNCRDEEKRRRIQDWLSHHVNLTMAGPLSVGYAYGDSSGDRHMLEMAHTAVWVKRRDISVPDDQLVVS